ncbi:efflux RND transporter permease subunit [Fimbriiglobus ruber]|uniref:Cobalt-zinc-cadmium resistance protein CzcA / Cation efflux system protein CusA n=1 Tax=Fimbriiglobus ruber TaxID=1908690 RepID=A0A225DGM2_9BACT|nr:efflux RND transporter permease subunit [Fimbriiglobus ruber]OWK37678.1 Cobalt-zinc-cadmium resistance protein CzcA / Cation efflux system protein CusA [Fimbriiglobus ruber]
MIERLIEASVRNRFVVLALAAALAVGGVYATLQTPVDAIPDLSENQVIVFTDWPGRSPREIEDQITYPLSLRLQGLAGIKAVRSSSEFNFSMITLIFEESTDFYFARQRVLERLTQAGAFLPAGVVPYMAPDATALGQVFWYTVEPSPSHPVDPGRLWAVNKFYIAPQLNSAAGVAEVAPVGGTPLEYQIDVRPETLRTYGVTVGELFSAVSRSNLPAGGGVIQKNNAEYIVRGVGWLKDTADIENTVVKEINGIPVYVKTVATVQVGTQFRRSVFEKDGNEVVGGVVLMRHGGNPLAVTERVKAKIQELQPGLPPGVQIVPAYDRTRLITGAIHTLTEVMWHEMLIAGVAILLILGHVRSVFVICVTLPLSVLFSFLLMFLLRKLGVIDIQANVMSLAGITISIGILVDQAIVMTENATHHLKERFGDQKVTGDTREIVVRACRTVGRPIFFSVLIMLLSFVPVFMLSGREGKYFHPLAFTKSFALLGVALISVTVVPALIPTFIRGRLRSEEENWIVRGFIRVYRPLLTWALPRRNLVMWAFAALLILAAGLFPVQALVGMGASESAWGAMFLIVFGVVTVLTVAFTRGFLPQAVSLATLVLLALWAWHFPKIGVSFMPALDEGTTLDMPVTVPRVSVTEAADDLKARDALLRGFPEVESVVGKAGRADTPTDPAPLDMVETFVNFRPRELWPKRVLRFPDADLQTRAVLRALEDRGYLLPAPHADDRENVVNEAAQRALERFDETIRELALRHYVEFEQELGPMLTRFVVAETLRRMREAGHLDALTAGDEAKLAEELSTQLTPDEGVRLAKQPALEAITRIQRQTTETLAARKVIGDAAVALEIHEGRLGQALGTLRESLGGVRETLAGAVLRATNDRRHGAWIESVNKVNWELFDRGTEAFTWYAIDELVASGSRVALVQAAPLGIEAERFAAASKNVRLGKPYDADALEPLGKLRAELEGPFRERVFLWRRTGGPKGDLVDDEFGRVLQVPGWSNIFTQPIINRIEMLSTGVRTDIGIKVFGPDLDTVDRVCKRIEAAVKPVPGARDVIAAPIMGKGYLDVTIDRERAARYGVTVEDIETEIEMALGGRVVTQTVEKRDRFPVRVRYARAGREDEEAVKRLLVTGSARADRPAGDAMSANTTTVAAHPAAPGPAHAARGKVLIPLASVADVRIVEGPAVIKSENGRLLNYVTLNVRGRDAVGFVEEARRVVEQKVKLPEGVHVEWAGEFEHQERAARTLKIVLPVVILVIFLLLYLTYHDFADAVLMMLAVPEALAGGAFFLYFFPKLVYGWHSPPVDFSVAVWVGFIACFGMATETGIIMLVYLREAIEKRGGLENIRSLDELREAVIEGAVHRLRPKLLTEGVAIVAIFPMVFASGVGGEVLAPMALPVLGGLLISDEVVDLFLPVRFYWVRRARWLKLQEEKARSAAAAEQVALVRAMDGSDVVAGTAGGVV